jgi:hypothetical protein
VLTTNVLLVEWPATYREQTSVVVGIVRCKNFIRLACCLVRIQSCRHREPWAFDPAIICGTGYFGSKEEGIGSSGRYQPTSWMTTMPWTEHGMILNCIQRFCPLYFC